MARNGGCDVHVGQRRIRERGGTYFPLDRLEVGEGVLYYARETPDVDIFRYHERWLLLERGWSLSRFDWTREHPTNMDWYIETDLIKVAGDTWSVRDGYVDVLVFEGTRYEVDDVGELADGLAAGEITVDEMLRVLQSFDELEKLLRGNGFSGNALIREFAKGVGSAS